MIIFEVTHGMKAIFSPISAICSEEIMGNSFSLGFLMTIGSFNFSMFSIKSASWICRNDSFIFFASA